MSKRYQIVVRSHPHFGEHGTLVEGEKLPTGQLILKLDDCIHGTEAVGVDEDEIA